MYIDFVKYNYDCVDKNEKDKYIVRDKEGYKGILKKWLEENIDEIVERKWDIDDIFYIDEISEFLNLLREAENLYEFGFFTSCIALIGVSAEDLSKYLILEKMKQTNDNLTQQQRLAILKKNNIITTKIYNRLDEIRKCRNDCLHYNNKFKQKSYEELKKEALKTLNNLKHVIADIFGVKKSVTIQEFSEIIENSIDADFTNNKNTKNFDDYAFRNRNAMSHLLKIDLAHNPDIKINLKMSTYRIEEIDLEISEYGEVTLIDLENGIPVYVDLTSDFRKNIIDIDLKENDMILAVIYSEIDEIGLSGLWYFKLLKKIII